MPKVVFLENVENLVSHDGGNTFKIILNTLENELNYHVVGVTRGEDGSLIYDKSSFIRNTKNLRSSAEQTKSIHSCIQQGLFGEHCSLFRTVRR